MKVCIVYFGTKKIEALSNIAKGLSKGIEAQGHDVDIIDGIRESEKKITIYRYICIGTESISFLGKKLLPQISEFLTQSGAVISKPCYSFVLKTPFGTDNTLLRLMRVMEGEGMLIRNSGILSSKEHAEAVGKTLKIVPIS